MEFNNKSIVIFSEHYCILLFITVECCNKLRKNTTQTNVDSIYRSMIFVVL